MAGQNDAVRAWKYTCNDGVTTYRLRAKTAIVEQVDGASAVKVGGESCSTEVALPPRGFRPRRVYVQDATGKTRSVVCYDADCPLATEGETVSIQTAGDATSFESSGIMLEERRPRGIVDQS